MVIDKELWKLKTNIKDNKIEVFLMLKDLNLYQLFKNNSWKKHSTILVEKFKGYNDKHMALKFVIEPENPQTFTDELMRIINGQIQIHNISNVSYEEFEKRQEQRKRDNYNIFMDALKGKSNA